MNQYIPGLSNTFLLIHVFKTKLIQFFLKKNYNYNTRPIIKKNKNSLHAQYKTSNL